MTNKKSKAEFENIQPSIGSSFFINQFNKKIQNRVPVWHFHPELELVYINGGSGRRHVGHHLSYFNDGDLMLIGSNLPHAGFTDRLTGNRSETIVQMKPDFLGEHFLGLPEMQAVKQLFEKAKMGITFQGQRKEAIGKKLEELPWVDPYKRLLSLLEILYDLSICNQYTILNSEGIILEVSPQDNARMNTIYSYVRKNFQQAITLEEVADLTHMTIPSFCRFFKRKAGKNFTQFVNEYRLVHASKLLSEETTSITEICLASGFNNFSHFNKAFKIFTGKSPSAYRNAVKKIIN